eukprot:gene13296-16000_t
MSQTTSEGVKIKTKPKGCRQFAASVRKQAHSAPCTEDRFAMTASVTAASENVCKAETEALAAVNSTGTRASANTSARARTRAKATGGRTGASASASSGAGGAQLLLQGTSPRQLLDVRAAWLSQALKIASDAAEAELALSNDSSSDHDALGLATKDKTTASTALQPTASSLPIHGAVGAPPATLDLDLDLDLASSQAEDSAITVAAQGGSGGGSGKGLRTTSKARARRSGLPVQLLDAVTGATVKIFSTLTATSKFCYSNTADYQRVKRMCAKGTASACGKWKALFFEGTEAEMKAINEELKEVVIATKSKKQSTSLRPGSVQSQRATTCTEKKAADLGGVVNPGTRGA